MKKEEDVKGDEEELENNEEMKKEEEEELENNEEWKKEEEEDMKVKDDEEEVLLDEKAQNRYQIGGTFHDQNKNEVCKSQHELVLYRSF